MTKKEFRKWNKNNSKKSSTMNNSKICENDNYVFLNSIKINKRLGDDLNTILNFEINFTSLECSTNHGVLKFYDHINKTMISKHFTCLYFNKISTEVRNIVVNFCKEFKNSIADQEKQSDLGLYLILDSRSEFNIHTITFLIDFAKNYIIFISEYFQNSNKNVDFQKTIVRLKKLIYEFDLVINNYKHNFRINENSNFISSHITQL